MPDMLTLGIDIGTTTISVVMVDADSGALTARETIEHRSFLDDGCAVGKVQDPERIWAIVRDCVDRIIREHGKPACVGLTGQMHGMLYVDGCGNAISPLYTWQDGRGDLPLPEDRRSAAQLLRDAGCESATGYGLTTHCYLLKNGLVPRNARSMTTIPDYIAMKLTGSAKPVLCADMAASWGAYDLSERAFRTEKLEALGVDLSLLPECRQGCEVVGQMPEGIPVTCALGDNQASVLGSVRDATRTALLNIGTGSQISVGTDRFIEPRDGLELRPCTADGYMLVGFGLCGGRAYAMLERFYREIAGTDAPRYDIMLGQARAFIEEKGLDAAWSVRTTFSGTRANPAERGSIAGIGVDNFRPGALTAGLIAGILEELHVSYKGIVALTGTRPDRLVGSGNGLRKNPLMRQLAESMFGMKLMIPVHREEAAFGAALCALAASGQVASLEDAQALIQYHN